MEREIIETVLTEILEELKQLKTLTTTNTNATLDNANRLSVITDKVESKQVIKPDITQSIEQILLSGLGRINSTMNRKPEPIKREFRILLFPEYNTGEYYRIVFGRIIFWLVLLVITKYFYLLGNEWVTKNYENQKYKKAWENLYQYQKKENQKIMQKIMGNY